MLCMSPSKMFLHIFAEFSYLMLLVMLCWFLFLYFLYFKQTFLLVSIKYCTHFLIGSNSVFVFENGPFSSSLDKTWLFCWILVLQSTGDQTCKQGPSDVQLLLQNTGHSPLSCASVGCLKIFRLEALSLGKCPIAQGQDWGGRGKSNQTKWRRENPTRCWLTGRKRCGTSVWRSRKASNRYLQGILAPHAENGPKSRRQICRIMHHIDMIRAETLNSTWGLLYDTRWLCECNSDPWLPWLMSCGTVWTATSSHLQHWLVQALDCWTWCSCKGQKNLWNSFSKNEEKAKECFVFPSRGDIISRFLVQMQILHRLFLDWHTWRYLAMRPPPTSASKIQGMKMEDFIETRFEALGAGHFDPNVSEAAATEAGDEL